ncbi:MAG: alpha/beta hydrolase [Desulfobaccales bacterium]
MEEQIDIQAGDVTLEARFIPGSIPAGAVITHPHPLYGGSMDNNVVWTASRALGDRGWATLRFNFRGVGASSGRYGEGRAEVGDVIAALAWLKSRVPGPCYVVGYSFGAAVAARALLNGLETAGAVLIAPPIAFMDLAFLPETPGLHLIIAGERDDLCPLADLEALLSRRQPPVDLKVVPGADHFFAGREKELYQVLKNYPFAPEPA